MVSFNDLKDIYLFSGVNISFSEERRKDLRYACETAYVYHTSLNPNGPEPFEYLDYAKKDIAKADVHGAIDGISNAKRAIHLVIDKYFELLGLDRAYAKASFPAKIEVMELLNAFPTRLIERLNKKRNLIEHEYRTIAREEVIEFIDIAEMFLLLAHPYLKHTTTGALVGIQDDERCIEWTIQPEGEVHIYDIPNQSFIDTPIGKVFYNVDPHKELEKTLLETIIISKTNREHWLSYLDFFVYMTKNQATQMPMSETGGKGIQQKRFSRFYFGPPDDL